MKKSIFQLLLAIIMMAPVSLVAQSASTTIKKTTTPKKVVKKKKSTTSTASTTKAAEPKPIMPVMTFNTKFTDFGKVKTGDKPSMTYEFTNIGNAPLDIEICTGCECTEIDWTRTTVQPGQKGFVKAVFNTVKAEAEDHKKQLTKYVDIILKQTHPKNGYPLVESLKFDVFIVD